MWTLEEKRSYHREWMRRKRLTPEHKAWQKAYYSKPEVRAKKNAYHAQWIKEHPEKHKMWTKKWFDENPEKKKLMTFKQNCRRRASRKYREVDLIKLLSSWDNTCGICGKTVRGDFHIDHIMPLSKGGLHEFSNLQFTHPLCNWRKNDRVLA